MLEIKADVIMAIKRNAQFIIDSLCNERLDSESATAKQAAQGIISYVAIIEQALYLSRTKKAPPKAGI